MAVTTTVYVNIFVRRYFHDFTSFAQCVNLIHNFEINAIQPIAKCYFHEYVFQVYMFTHKVHKNKKPHKNFYFYGV